MLRGLLTGGGDPIVVIMQLLSTAFVVFCTLPIHEYAHALVATKLGDQTARLSGRLTLSPLRHIDVIGAIMIFIAGFGYAKPVPVNMNNLKTKNRKVGMALVALAGPVSNIIMAAFFILLKNICAAIYESGIMSELLATIIAYFFYFAASINVSLAVFNLIPIPPLDGSRILFSIIPDRFYYKIMRYERQIMIGMLILLALGVFSVPLSFLSDFLYNALNKLISLPFNLIR